MVHGAVIDGCRLVEPIQVVIDGHVVSDGWHLGASVFPTNQDTFRLLSERRFDLL